MVPMLTLVALAAQAATPNPDRPSVSRSGYLVAPDTLELETGLLWSEGARAVPTTLKYAFGEVAEGRISADLSGFDAAPLLEAGAKVALVDRDTVGLSAFAASALPVVEGERWSGTAQGLLTVPIDSWSLQFNSGVLLVGEPGGVAFGGVPVVGAVGVSFAGSFSAFAELAAVVGAPQCESAACTGIVDGGLGWLLTDILIVDVGVGWDLDVGVPFAQAGLTANLGGFRAL